MSLGLLLLLFAFIPAAAFVVLYGTVVPWWRSWEGQHLFLFTLAIAVLLGASVWTSLGGPLHEWFEAGVVVALGLLLWQRLWLLVRAQWLRRNGGGR